MIDIRDADYFIKVLDEAVKLGAADKLVDKIRYLTEYGEGDNCCELYEDHAPLSFAFLMKRSDGTRWFNGGLIYSGPQQPLGGSAPALTVGIGIDSSVHGWSIHT